MRYFEYEVVPVNGIKLSLGQFKVRPKLKVKSTSTIVIGLRDMSSMKSYEHLGNIILGHSDMVLI